MGFSYRFKPYIAIIGDIIESRKLVDRYEWQKKLSAVLETVNTRCASDISSRFMITLGDEFQGLLHDGSHVMEIIEFIQIEMYPMQIRFGIGIGKIETEINHLLPFGADGSAYHNARKMIDELKKNEKKKKASDANIMISSDGDYSETEILLNTILSLCAAIRKRWTARQREIAFDCLINGESQRKAAQRLHISQPAVQRHLASADYYTYKKSMDAVAQSLANIKEDSEVNADLNPEVYPNV